MTQAPPPTHSPAPAPRPAVAIISNTYTPYRIHLHQRLTREMPEIQLWSLFTHDISHGAGWKLDIPPEIGPVAFGPGESSADQGRPGRMLHEWRKGGRIIRWLKAHEVRAVVMCGYSDPGRVRILRWCGRHRIPCLMHGDSNARNEHLRGWKQRLKERILRRLLRHCFGALPVGTLGARYFQKYGIPAERCFLFPLEPDYDLIQSLPPQRIQSTTATFRLDPQRRRIVFVGRLLRLKRVDLLIDAFASIAEQRPQWDLLIVGDGPEKESLAARIPPAIAPRVQWAGYVSDSPTLAALYHACDLLALTSEKEAWGLVLNEAAAAGLAIVASDVVGAAAELVRENVNGRTFPPGDLATLTDCLLHVTDAQRIDAMKAASAAVLADWRRRADAVKGLREALRAAGVLPGVEGT